MTTVVTFKASTVGSFLEVNTSPFACLAEDSSWVSANVRKELEVYDWNSQIGSRM